MQYRKLGTSGIEASVVGLGAWAIGGWMWGGSDESQSIRAIQAAVDCGMNLLDTAPIYGFGRSEEIVGKAIADRRDKVVLATKCGLIWHEAQGEHAFDSDEMLPGRGKQYEVYRCNAPRMIRYEIEESLRRLQTDYIDLLQTHWQEKTTAIADTMGTLLELKKEGKIRAIGCCNATPEQMDEYRQVCPLDSDQEPFSMLNPKHLSQNLPYCEQHDIAFLAYSPLAQGLLTGKMGPEREFEDGDQRRNNPRFSLANRQKIQTLLDHFQPIAKQHQISMSQLVIAWTVAQPGCSHALVGARSPEQVLENAGGGDVTLSQGELEAMHQALESFLANG